MTARRQMGLVIGVAGLAALGYGIYEIMVSAGCEMAGRTGCTDPSGSSIGLLIGGIIAAIVGSVLAQNGLIAFSGSFVAVGVGSLAAGLSSETAGGRLFPVLFGAGFLIGGLAPFAVAVWARRKRARAVELMRSGRQAVGTVLHVRDTGVTVNDNPRVEITFSLAPLDGDPPFEAVKTSTVSRVAIPRRGDAFPVWIDRNDPSVFAFGVVETQDARERIIADFGFDPWRTDDESSTDP